MLIAFHLGLICLRTGTSMAHPRSVAHPIRETVPVAAMTKVAEVIGKNLWRPSYFIFSSWTGFSPNYKEIRTEKINFENGSTQYTYVFS